MKSRQLIATGLLLALTGSLQAQNAIDPAARAQDGKAASAESTGDDKSKVVPDFEPRIMRGDDKLINMPPAYTPVEGSPSGYKFEDAPIQDVVTVFMREVLKVDYVLHQPITGSVTLATRGPISPDDALSLLESALQVNGLAMGRDSRGVYHVGKLDSLKGVVSNIRVAGNKGPLPPGYGVVIIPLEFIGATEMAAILKPMVQGEAIVRVDTLRNMLVMVGTRNQAEGWMDMVKTFDVNMLKGMSVGVFPLKYASVKEVESALQLLNSSAAAGGGGASGGAARPAGSAQAIPGGAGGAAGAAAASAPAVALSENFPLYGALRVLPIARINSILVVTPRAAYLEEARRWIEKLDKPSDNGAEPQLFIYQVQNVNSRHLATVLSGIFSGMQNPFQSGNAQGATGATGVAPGQGGVAGVTGSNNAFNNNAFNSSMGGYNNAYGGNTMGGYGGGYAGGNAFGQSAGSGIGSGGLTSLRQSNTANSNRPSISVTASFGSIRVVADELNNSVLIWATRAEYERIEATLKRLDIPPTQVLIEASIIEVTLNDTLNYGLKWAFTDQSANGSKVDSSGIGYVGGAPQTGPLAGGFSYSVLNPYGRVRAALTALSKITNLKVVSSPSLMVLDNHTATISVGDQQPVQTSTTYIPNSTTATTTSTIQYKDTGVSLVVTPSVNAGNLVTMQIDQMLTDLGAQDADTKQYAFMQRQISSKVAVRSGDAIVLGGLIKDSEQAGKTGVPLLSRVPVLGALFGEHTKDTKRTELLVVISPRVVRTDIDIREVSDELRDRMKGLRDVEAFDREKVKPKTAAPISAPQPQ
ncbi:type II secretion system secretin GspD [Diaphorobacter sp. HDW4A]|uniref:type II secretion system secretin GspD n=1 Tax=Diaphorobacter sp. HDW4A TaxID=2714924 RepID=UPI00140D9025|nr:type II secretion system secretin GspD [Diaphorobacter sp. HDW4A]QIL81860.1 type II secretion system secretin GspD [Diaphorobacter sp. HDW4A]